ncbi:hypothetical protein ABT336_01350 [Micromonospora sp. NPDC000207]|uniref:hypothetical protein n=1 Tax=Micromonospora sp. NPDC000207 TaxID=3154246 RepID=UPI00332F9D1D
MAHGEAEHGCAQGESCRPGHHEQPGAGKHPRRPACGAAHPSDQSVARTPECTVDEPVVPRQRTGEVVGGSPTEDGRSCLSDLPGWAGAHRHGPVRPRRRRTGRRERPPQRWC